MNCARSDGVVPAKGVCVEEKDGSPHVYWLARKTQLIRAAPHHVRPDCTAIEETAVENLRDAAATLQSLKSRGVTRFIYLNRVNKPDLLDVEEHEEEMSPDEGPEHKRRRYDATIDEDLEDYTPSEPPNEGKLQGTRAEDETVPAEPAAPPVLQDHLLPAVPEHQREPSIEPEPPSVPPTPMHLDPVTSEAYRAPSMRETCDNSDYDLTGERLYSLVLNEHDITSN